MWSTSAGTDSPERMLPKTMPLPGGRGWRMSPVRAPEWSPCPFTSTLRPMVRSGKRRAGASEGAAPAAAGAAVSAAVAFVPSARPTTLSSASSGNGFSRKSKAPRRMTRTAVSIVPCPEMTMIGTPGAWLRMRSTSSMPSISGIHTSTIASRGAACWSSSRARRPSGASSTSKPSSASTPRSVCRMFSSSSTTRIVSDIPHLHPTLRAGVRPVLGAGGELRRAPADRKLEDETAAAREVVPHADEPVVVRDDGGHDGEPEPGAVGLGREVGLEQPRLHLRRHARAVVGDLEPHHAEARVVPRRQLDAREMDRGGAAAAGLGAGGDRVVEQVEQRPLDPLTVHLELGQLGLGIEREADLAVAFAEEDERLLDQPVQVLQRVRARRHAREGGELVHQRLQLVDLLDDGARALLEHGAVGAEARGVAAAKPLRRELDRRERILDLVRDAARDFPPGLHPL